MANQYTQKWQQACDSAKQKGWQIIEHGWEQHVLVDKEAGTVYRYPRHQAAADKLKDEVAVLQTLNKLDWPIRLPYILEHTDFYTKYEFIPGEVLDEFEINSLSEADFDKIGLGLGVFLAQLHTLDPAIIDQKKTKQTTSLLEYYRERIEAASTARHYQQAHSALTQLMHAAANFSEVVVHGDLHGLNIVINPESKDLQGVIDMSEMEIGDPHQDFRKLFMTSAHIVEPAIAAYHQAGGQQIDPYLVRLWAYVNEWANLCYFAHTPENGTYQRALAHLTKWHQLSPAEGTGYHRAV